MALLGTRLKTALRADILTQLQSSFPVNGALQASEQTTLNARQVSLANAIADAVGPDVVTEIAGNATLVVVGVTAGGATATGTVV